MSEIKEEYVDLTAEEILKILKQKIESGRDFNVTFRDNTNDLSIHVDYVLKKKAFEMHVVKVINLEPVDVAYGYINIPDRSIVGTGHIYTLTGDKDIVSIGASGKSVRIWRYDRTLFFSRID
jgi:hypothetical protein